MAEDVTFRNNVIDTDAPGEAVKLVAPLGTVRIHGNRFTTPGRARRGLEFCGAGDVGVWVFDNEWSGFTVPRTGDPGRARLVANTGLVDVVPARLSDAEPPR